jgi:Uncharacterized conserved protein
MPEFPKTGACRCGAVRLMVSAAPVMTAACHCNGCKKMSSSAFSLTAMIPSETLTVAGEVVKGGIQGPELDHYFCPSCKTWMFTRIIGFDALTNIRPTLFDTQDAEIQDWCRPFIETMAGMRLPWVMTPAEHVFEGMPDMVEFPALLKGFAERG